MVQYLGRVPITGTASLLLLYVDFQISLFGAGDRHRAANRMMALAVGHHIKGVPRYMAPRVSERDIEG